MGLLDFVKDAGKSVLGSEAEAAPAPAAAQPAQSDTDRKVAALKAELTECVRAEVLAAQALG